MNRILPLLLLLCSCARSSLTVVKDDQTLYSRLSIPIENSFLGLKLQLYSLDTEMYGYIICNDFVFEEGKCIALTLKIHNDILQFDCPILLGSQKLFLPKAAVIKIIHGLKEGNRIHISIEDDQGFIDGGPDFEKKYDSLCKNLSFFDKIIEKGLEYIDATNYQ